mgnify:CR=1 FL=1
MAEQDFKFDDALLMKTAREMLANLRLLSRVMMEQWQKNSWERPNQCTSTIGTWSKSQSSFQEKMSPAKMQCYARR